MRLKSLAAWRWPSALLLGSAQRASAQDYPTRPVKIVIAFSPSGAIDMLGRFIADKLEPDVGPAGHRREPPGRQRQHRRGGRGAAAPDGYTLHFGAQTLAAQRDAVADHGVRSDHELRADHAGRHLAEVFKVSVQTPFNSVQDVIDYAKANPGKLNYGSVGIGSSAHLATVLFMDVTGIKMQHVPYSQMSQGIADVMSGRTEVWFRPVGGSIANIRSGKMRALAVNGPARSKLLPDLPTFEELGVKMGEESSWYGFFAPKGTPKPIIDKINRDLQTVIDMPDMSEREVQLGYRFIGGPPERLAVFLKSEIAKWQALDKKGAFK